MPNRLHWSLVAFVLGCAHARTASAQAIAPVGATARAAPPSAVLRPGPALGRRRETTADYIIGTAALGASLGGLGGLVYGVIDCRRRDRCRGSGLGEVGSALLHSLEGFAWGAAGGAGAGALWYVVDVRRGVVGVEVRADTRGLTWR